MDITLTFDTTVDAMSLQQRSGEYQETLSFNLEGVDLNLDIDAEGYVLQLEVLSATKLLELIGRYGGRMVIPERITDPDTFDVVEMFPAAPAHGAKVDRVDKITEVTLAEIEAEYAKWAEFLNIGVGVVAFNLGVSCLGTPFPSITSFLALLFMTLVLYHGSESFPKKIRELRAGNLVGIEEIKLKGIEAKYFGYTAPFRRFPLYFVGMVFLFAVWLLSGTSVI